MISKYLDPKNDYAFKKIFGEEKHKQIPIAFLNAVFHLKGKNRIIDLEFLNLTQVPAIAARKESVVDLLVKDQNGAKYIVEMQVAKIEGFEKRAQFYAAKTYFAPFNVGQAYRELKKVIFLAITSYVVFPDKKDYKSDHVILDNKTYQHDLKDFSFSFVELPKFTKNVEELETLEEKWYYFLKHADESNEVDELMKSPEIREAYEVIERFSWSEQEFFQYERAAMAIADARGALSAAKKEGLEEGIKEGIKQGIEKVIKEGIKKGENAIYLKMVKALLAQGMKIEQIQALTNLSENEIASLTQSLSNH